MGQGTSLPHFSISKVWASVSGGSIGSVWFGCVCVIACVAVPSIVSPSTMASNSSRVMAWYSLVMRRLCFSVCPSTCLPNHTSMVTLPLLIASSNCLRLRLAFALALPALCRALNSKSRSNTAMLQPRMGAHSSCVQCSAPSSSAAS